MEGTSFDEVMAYKCQREEKSEEELEDAIDANCEGIFDCPPKDIGGSSSKFRIQMELSASEEEAQIEAIVEEYVGPQEEGFSIEEISYDSSKVEECNQTQRPSSKNEFEVVVEENRQFYEGESENAETFDDQGFRPRFACPLPMASVGPGRSKWDENKVGETLRSLRNFCNVKDPFDPRISQILKPGHMLLSVNKVVEYLDCYDGKENLRNGEGFICIVQEEHSTTFYHIPTRDTFVNNQCSLVEKPWFYRKGRTVLLAPYAEDLKTFKFQTAEEAAKFEFDIFIAGIFCRYPILRLSGELPAQQLKCKWFLGDSANEINQMRMILKVQQEESDISAVKISISQNEYIDNIRRRIEAFLEYAKRIPFLKWSSKFTSNEEHKWIIYHVWSDLQTVFRMIPYLSSEGFSKSLQELAEDMGCLEYTLRCSNMMMKCSEKYFEYFLQVMLINRDVWRLLSKFNSVDEEKKKFDLIDENELKIAVTELREMSLTAEKQATSASQLSERIAAVNCVEAVSGYLLNQRTTPDFPKLFDKLDHLLRVGNDSIFDILCRNFKKEMLESLLPLKTIVKIGHEIFAERPVDPSFLKTADLSKAIRLSELQERPRMYSDRTSSAFSRIENVFCLKVAHSIIIFESILSFVENGIGFKKDLWMLLRNIRNIISDLPPLLDRDEDEKDENQNYEEKNDNGSQDFSLCEDAFESIFSFPRSWETYAKFVESDFQEIKDLGAGAYGAAKLMKHYRLRRVVCKQFLDKVEEADRIKEMDMLVKLQGNKNIVGLHGFYYSSNEFFDCVPLGFVMEYVELNLYGLIHDRKEVSFKSVYSLRTALEYIKDMASGFSAMHALGFYHRDIKPGNILLLYGRQIRICDFGTCGNIKTLKTGQFGTHQYKSPEMLNVLGIDDYNEKTDVYSLAVTVWQLMHRKLPYAHFRSNGAITAFVVAGERLPIKDSVCPDGLKDLIERSWAQNPSERPTMSEIEKLASSLITDLSREVLEAEIT